MKKFGVFAVVVGCVLFTSSLAFANNEDYSQADTGNKIGCCCGVQCGCEGECQCGCNCTDCEYCCSQEKCGTCNGCHSEEACCNGNNGGCCRPCN